MFPEMLDDVAEKLRDCQSTLHTIATGLRYREEKASRLTGMGSYDYGIVPEEECIKAKRPQTLRERIQSYMPELDTLLRKAIIDAADMGDAELVEAFSDCFYRIKTIRHEREWLKMLKRE